VAAGEASEVILEDTVNVADFRGPGLNSAVLKPYGPYARFIMRGVEASPSLTAYVRESILSFFKLRKTVFANAHTFLYQSHAVGTARQ
jgi:hypothetical protein